MKFNVLETHFKTRERKKFENWEKETPLKQNSFYRLILKGRSSNGTIGELLLLKGSLNKNEIIDLEYYDSDRTDLIISIRNTQLEDLIEEGIVSIISN